MKCSEQCFGPTSEVVMNVEEIKAIVRRVICDLACEWVVNSLKEALEQLEVKREGKIEEVQKQAEAVKKICAGMFKGNNKAIHKVVSSVGRLKEYSRNENVIIRGIQWDEKEEGKGVLEVELQGNHSSTLHCLLTHDIKRPPPVTIRLETRWGKEKLIAASKPKKLRGIFILNHTL